MTADQADAADIRRVLREHGHQVNDRGNLSNAQRDIYDAIIADGADAGQVTYDGPGAVSDSDFGPDGIAGVSRETVQPERTPGSVKGESARSKGRRLFSRRKPRRRTRSRGSGSQAMRDRLPVAPLLERAWMEFAHMARAMPPVQRIMAAQAPMAGVVLEDATRDTITDRVFLQPVARQEERLEAVNAMIGSVMWAGLITKWGSVEVEQATDEKGRVLVASDGSPVLRPVIDPATGRPAYDDRTRLMIGGLRLSLMSMFKIAQRNADEIIAKAEELNTLSDQADQMMAWILSPPDPAKKFADVQREARDYASTFFYRGPGSDHPDVSRETSEPAPAPVPAVGAVVAVPDVPGVPHPDIRTMTFVPPDPRIASQVVPRPPIPL